MKYEELINYLHNKFKEEGKFVAKRFIGECIKEGRTQRDKEFEKLQEDYHNAVQLAGKQDEIIRGFKKKIEKSFEEQLGEDLTEIKNQLLQKEEVCECGHKRPETIILDDNELSYSAYLEYWEQRGKLCWDCFCFESIGENGGVSKE
jgi:vacuolar-type H+-ATPase subunit H